MANGQWVQTSDGFWGEIVESSQSRFGSASYRIIGEFGEGWYSAREVLSDVDDDTTTDINFHDSDANDENGEASSTLVPSENHWLDGGTKLPYDPDPTEEWDGQLTQEFEDHDIDLKPTNSLKGHDVHPDPIDHNAIWGDHAKQAARFAFDADDEDWAETQDYSDREHGVNRDKDISNGNYDDGHNLKSIFDGGGPKPAQYGTPSNPAPVHVRRASVGPRQAFVDYLNLIESNSLVREAAWSDVRRKANRLYRSGNVSVVYNDGKEIQAKVDGDHGRYAVKVARKNAFGKGITWYDCDCEWGKWAYKRSRTFVGRLCSHGLAAYFAMQANKQPEKPVKRINDNVERHSLAAAPKAHKVESESLAARSGGLMIWDDDLQKVVKNFFPSPPTAAQVSADPGAGAAPAAPAGDPAGTIGPDMSTELAQDNPAAPTFDGADANFMPDPNPGTPLTDKVRTAEFEKNPKTDDLFEKWPEANSEDAETFNDTDKKYKDKDNDPEFAVYDNFWGRSSSIVEAGPYEDAFKGGLNPGALMDIAKQPTVTPSLNDAPIPEPGRKLPHFIRRKNSAADRSEIEGHSEQELRDIAERFNLNGEPQKAQLFIDNRRKLEKGADNHSDGNVDYAKSVDDDHKTNWEDDPNDGVNGDSNSYNDDNDHYQSKHWLDEDEAEWNDHDPKEDDDDDDEFLKKGWNSKSAAFQNEAEAEEFNADADAVVRAFQRSAAGQGLFSDSDDSGAFETVATDPRRVKTAGRHFTFSEQQELIDEPGHSHFANELDLDGTFYLE